jgi:hypothetical protein
MFSIQNKNTSSGIFGRTSEWKMMLYIISIGNILRPSGIFNGHLVILYQVILVHLFAPFVYCTKKNLATLEITKNWQRVRIKENQRNVWIFFCAYKKYHFWLREVKSTTCTYLGTRLIQAWVTRLGRTFAQWLIVCFRHLYTWKLQKKWLILSNYLDNNIFCYIFGDFFTNSSGTDVKIF